MHFSDDVFPFRICFDGRCAITEAGSSLLKLDPSVQLGQSVHDVVSFLADGNLISPASEQELLAMAGQPITVRLKRKPIELRGQLQSDDGQFVVLGNPYFESVEQFRASGLELKDFAPQDRGLLESILRNDGGDIQSDAGGMPASATPSLGDTSQLGPAALTPSCDLHSAGDMLLRLDASNRILEVHVVRCDLLDVPSEQLLGREVFAAFPELSRALRNVQEKVRICGDPVDFSYEFRRNGEWRYFDARITLSRGGEMVVVVRDVSEQRKLKQQLEHQATHDPLTDLPNRKLFTQLVQRALDEGSFVGILFIDLNDFKLVNDRYGHQYGDDVLQAVSRSIKRLFHGGDVGARFGGDEFAVLLTSIGSRFDAERMAQQLIDDLMQPQRIGQRMLSIPVSIGIATSFDSSNMSRLLQFADIAMYRAKACGMACHEVFDVSMYNELLRRDTLQQQLLVAGEYGQFVNHYQPMIDLGSRRVMGVELLVRWNHPTRGLLYPRQFLSLADQCGAIVSLGEHTIRQACLDASERDRLGVPPCVIHVNVSDSQLKRSCIVTLMRELIAEGSLPPERFVVEVKEETLQSNFELARLEIERLCDLGVGVALDEFGAGNSSLAFLERLPVRTVKLARSFVRQLGKSEANNELVKAVVKLARTFGKNVIAVGVETAAQEQLLVSYGCQTGQGMHYAEPLSNADLSGYVKKDMDSVPPLLAVPSGR